MSYCQGLLLPIKRKNVEPMAARLAPHNVRRIHQSLHHIVAEAPWPDRAVLDEVLQRVLPAMTAQSLLAPWIVGDAGFPKKGRHYVGVAGQCYGQLGKQENCRVAVSLSLSTAEASLPIAFDLYLPETWILDDEARKKTCVPGDLEFRTKPLIAIEQIDQALQAAVPRAPVLVDAAYGSDPKFREALETLGCEYVGGIASTLSFWPPGEQAMPAASSPRTERLAKLLRRSPEHQPTTAAQLAWQLPRKAWRKVTWRQGTKQPLRSRFASLRVRAAHRDYLRSEPWPEQWLLIEWPAGEEAPTKYWLSNLPSPAKLHDLASLAKQHWIIERHYEELKQELGLRHFEGRGWGDFHHHATLCIAAYGFLVAERSRFSRFARVGQLQLALPALPPNGSPAGRAQRQNPHSIATLREVIARSLLTRLPCCSFCHLLRLSHINTRATDSMED